MNKEQQIRTCVELLLANACLIIFFGGFFIVDAFRGETMLAICNEVALCTTSHKSIVRFKTLKSIS